MSERLRQQQYQLARHLRDPSAHPPPPGIEERRLQIYRELFFGSIESLLSNNFPVIRQSLGQVAWQRLVRAFYADYRSVTPLFTKIAEEFVAFVQQYEAMDQAAPWLPELAHYEWVEIALQLSDAPLPAHRADGDLLNGVPVLSPWVMALGYRWPVNAIGPDYLPTQAPRTHTLLLVHRDPNHDVQFSQITPLAYRLLLSLQSRRAPGREHLLALAEETGSDAGDMLAHGLALLEQLRVSGIVIGTAVEV